MRYRQRVLQPSQQPNKPAKQLSGAPSNHKAHSWAEIREHYNKQATELALTHFNRNRYNVPECTTVTESTKATDDATPTRPSMTSCLITETDCQLCVRPFRYFTVQFLHIAIS